MQDRYIQQAKIFKGLCDPSRLEILNLLKTGEKCACVIIRETGMLQSAVSYHMRILSEAGLVQSRQEGKWTHYRLNEEGKNTAIRLLEQLVETNTSQSPTCCS